MIARLSGVTQSMEGGLAIIPRRSDWLVSPEREAILRRGKASPRSRNQAASSLAGSSRLSLTSSLSALSGDTYSADRPSGGYSPVAKRDRAPRKAVRVLPEPVGAEARTWPPEAMTGQAAAWTGVGSP